MTTKMAPARSDDMGEWAPYKLMNYQQQWLCRWLRLAGDRFTEPFFSETIQKCTGDALNAHRFASLSSLDYLSVAAAMPMETVAPSAFIFHVSRCGSTLLSQLLGVNQRHIVLSEVPLLDELLRLPFKDGKTTPAEAEAALQASIALLGRKRSGDETHLFVKLDSWHIFFAAGIRKLYPEVPFVLLYRSPDEVVRSHQKRRGMQAVPGLIESALFGMSPEEVTDIDFDAYMGKVLAYYFSRFMAIAEQDHRAFLLNYRQGGMALLQQLAASTGLIFNEVETEKMEMRSRYHSKYPDQTFSEEPSELATSPALAPAQSIYLCLEQMRAARSAS